MKIWEKWKERCTPVISWCAGRWRLFFVLAQVLVLLASLLSYFGQVGSLTEYHFDREMLEGYTAEEYGSCFGGTIDEGYPIGMYDIVPDMVLPKGYYRYTVSYEGAADGSFCWPHTYVECYNGVEQAVTYLQGEITENTEELWVNADLNVAMTLFYNGSGSVTITGFDIQETTAAANIDLFSVVLLLAALNVIVCAADYDRRKGIPVQKKYVFGALAALSMVASYPLFLNYAINGHDFQFHLVRIEGIKDGILSGQFPVRINPDFYNGYGYANPVFYGEVLLYIPAFLRMVGFPLTTAYNVYAILVNILACFGGYYCFRKMFRQEGIALAVTMLYVLAPYRIMDMYLRTAVGEYTAMTFLPFVACGMYQIFTGDTGKKEYRWCFLPLVAGMTGIIQTHVLTGEMVGGVILAACVLLLFRTLQKARLWALVKAVLLTLGVNAWFLVPFVDFTLTQDLRFLQTSAEKQIQKTGTFWTQLMGLFPDYQLQEYEAVEGIAGEMPLSLGLPLVLGLLLCMLMLWTADKKEKSIKRQGLVFVLLAVMTIWMSTVDFPWDRIGAAIPQAAALISSLQFAWRLLTVATLLAASATGFGLILLREREGKLAFSAAAAVLCLLAGISSMYFMQECVNNREPMVMNNVKTLDTTVAAMGGEYVLCQAKNEVVTQIFEPRPGEGIQVTDYIKQGTNISFTVVSGETEGYVLLPLLNYKGYRAESEDGRIGTENLVTGEAAVVQVNIPANYQGTVKISYGGFWYWRAAEAVSLAVLVGLVLIYLRDKKRKGV